LERILKSAPLVTSPSLSRFLRYIVEETLAGRGAAIREFTLGINVFDRGSDFNPRLDPIVRVQARNLRARVTKYYEGPGAQDPIVIELPKGTYVPVFHRRTNGTGTETPAEAVAPSPAAAQPAVQPAVAEPAAEPAVAPAAAPASIMPVPPPRSPVAEPRGKPHILIAAVVLLAILIGIAALFLTQTHAAPGNSAPGALAEDLYIRGRYALDRETGPSLKESVQSFERALAQAPHFSAAHAGLADAYNVLSQFGMIAPREGMEKARAEANRAIELDPLLAEGHVALAAVLEAYDWNWREAEREYRRALELNPALPAAHLWYGMFLRDQGRVDEAVPELRRAAQLAPTSVLTAVNFAYGLLAQGNTAAAFEHAQRAVQMAPDQPAATILMVYASQAIARHEDAQAALERARKMTSGDPHSLALVACALVKYGHREESIRLARELERLSQSQYVSPYDLGKVSLVLGEEERALNYFEEAYRQRSSGLIFLRAARSCVRDRARFDSLVGKLHFRG
jgi:serine/threonine-protein kinase